MLSGIDSTFAIIAELMSSTESSAFFISRWVQIVHDTETENDNILNTAKNTNGKELSKRPTSVR